MHFLGPGLQRKPSCAAPLSFSVRPQQLKWWTLLYLLCVRTGSVRGQKTQGHLVQRENMRSLPQAAHHWASKDGWDAVLKRPLQAECVTCLCGSKERRAFSSVIGLWCVRWMFLFVCPIRDSLVWLTPTLTLSFLSFLLLLLLFSHPVCLLPSQVRRHSTCFLACTQTWPVTTPARRPLRRSSSSMATTITEASTGENSHSTHTHRFIICFFLYLGYSQNWCICKVYCFSLFRPVLHPHTPPPNMHTICSVHLDNGDDAVPHPNSLVPLLFSFLLFCLFGLVFVFF